METQGKSKELQEPRRALALSHDPMGKAQMSLMDQEAKREEADLQLALHLSRVEAQKQGRGGTHLSQQSEATEGTRSLIAGRTTTRAMD